MKTPFAIAQFMMILCMSFAASAETLSLKECLDAAINNNPAVAEARLNISLSEQSTASAKGKYFPRITFDANYTARQDPMPFIPAQSPAIGAHFSDKYASWALMMSLPLYQGGQITNGVELAKLRTALMQNSLNLTKNDLIANTVIAYYKLLQTRRLKEASALSLAALQEQLNNSRLMYNVGRIAKVDLLKIEAQFSNEHQRMLSLSEAEKTLSAAIRFFMGGQTEPQSEIINPSDQLEKKEIEADFSKAISLAKANRPEYRSALSAVDEADLNIKIAAGKMLPSINGFSAYLTQYGFNPNYHEGNWIAGINLSLPLFDMPLYSEYKREKIQKERVHERLKMIENQLLLEIQTAMSSLNDSRGRIEAAQKAVAQAQEAFRIELEKYKSGSGAMTDLLFSQAAAMTAEANYTQALFDYNAAQAAWRKATGTLEEYLK